MDIFEGLVVHDLPLPGRHLFADPDQIGKLHERGVLLPVGRDKLREHREHSSPKRGRTARPVSEGRLHALLRCAWDWISMRTERQHQAYHPPQPQPAAPRPGPIPLWTRYTAETAAL